jgi:hypothetical protein
MGAAILALALGIALAGATGAAAQNPREGRFAAIAERAITVFIRPGYERLADLAGLSQAATLELCAAPSGERLDLARRQFAALATGWARIALIRFGPVGRDNRFERIWFFPDRRGLALRQVQALIEAADEAGLDSAALAGASVGAQGLPALEFALFGTGSGGLAAPGGGFRCRYAAAVAGNIAEISAEIAGEWEDEAGHAAAMRQPGPNNPAYRSSEEVIRALLGAMTGQLTLVRDSVLLVALGDSAAAAQPRLAPFWRSGEALAASRAMVWSVLQLYETAGFDDALDDDQHWRGRQVRFEIANVLEAFDRTRRPVAEAAVDPADRPYLLFATVALRGALAALGNSFAAGIGISMGFNALDGD